MLRPIGLALRARLRRCGSFAPFLDGAATPLLMAQPPLLYHTSVQIRQRVARKEAVFALVFASHRAFSKTTPHFAVRISTSPNPFEMVGVEAIRSPARKTDH